MPTDARAALQEALQQALVVEHQLGLQYLYAAASLQWIPPEDLAPDDPSQVDYELARGAARTLLLLARQEMEHQGWVLNLLLATGAAPPTFDIPAMPVELPVGGPAMLQPFSQASLLRFIAAERPDHLDDPAGPCTAPPDLQTALAALEATDKGYGTPTSSAVYDLYETIYDAIVNVELTEGPVVLPPAKQQGNQFVPETGYGVHGGTVGSFSDALAAVDQIVLEGEGGSSASLWWALDANTRQAASALGIPADGPPPATTVTPAQCHYCQLVGLWPLVSSTSSQLPVLDVPTNPALTPGPNLELITNPYSIQVAEIAEAAFGILLDELQITYTAATLDPMDADAMALAAYFQTMTMVIRPLMMVLARLPRDTSDDTTRAGMTFRAAGRYSGSFEGTCDEARSSVVARFIALSGQLGKLLDSCELPSETADPSVVLLLLQGLQQDLLRIGENLAAGSSTPLGG